MKKWAVGILSSALILGAGTVVFAAGTNNSGEGNTFEKVLPFMQEMHPNSSNEDLQEMYNACHNDAGMMEGTNQEGMKSESMMNRF
ncbi:hypothetical protein P9D43_13520 [Neobacillus niacini]|uniref:hypothetical protein n=1 Tax=Neobacillus niacini TaxID=86668 RepID=UPI0007AB5F48|nr:hypothetical protein [Neobacillus niacini]MEC1523022.1 hypothetical protein [Neobacillus niacini]